MHRILGILAIVFLGFAQTARSGDTLTLGDVFSGSEAGAPLLTVERGWRGAEPDRILSERFKNKEGTIVASLISTYSAGSLKSVRYERINPKESATIDYIDGKAHYTHTRDGKTKRSVQAVSGLHVPFNAIPNFITSNWDDLEAGKTIACVVPIPIMRDAYNFKLTKTRTWTEQGRKLEEFKMESSSLLIRAVSDPFRYVYDVDSKSIVEFRGLIAASVAPVGSSKEFDARVSYRPTATTPRAGK